MPFIYPEDYMSGTTNQSKKETKKIVVMPYNPEWPRIFEVEALKIKEALGPNCLAIHHIGSTSVPGLAAKPVIDMIGVVKNPEKAIKPLESLGLKNSSLKRGDSPTARIFA